MRYSRGWYRCWSACSAWLTSFLWRRARTEVKRWGTAYSADQQSMLQFLLVLSPDRLFLHSYMGWEKTSLRKCVKQAILCNMVAFLIAMNPVCWMSCECAIFAGQGLSAVFYCFWKWSLEQVHMWYESVLVCSGCFLAGFPMNKGVPGTEQIVELPSAGSWKA